VFWIVSVTLLRICCCWADIWVVVLQEVWHVIYWTVHNYISVTIVGWSRAKHSRIWWISASHARTHCTR